ncbi:hypothetical protein Tco_0359440 [Tanacetum coccineum]
MLANGENKKHTAADGVRINLKVKSQVKYSKEPDNPTNCEFIRFLSDFSFGKKNLMQGGQKFLGTQLELLRGKCVLTLHARSIFEYAKLLSGCRLAGEVPPLYGECIRTNKESKEFAGELFEAGHHDRIRVRSHDGRNFSMDPPSRISSAEAYEMCLALWRQLKRRVITENTRKDVVESNIDGQASITESANQRRSTNIDLHNDTAIG